MDISTSTPSKTYQALPQFPNKYYDIRVVNAAECRQYPGTLTSLLHKEYDGLIIKGFLSKAEQYNMLDNIPRLTKDIEVPTPWGALYGKTLIGSEGNMDEYFAKAAKYREEWKNLLVFDIDNKIFDTLSALANNMPVGYAPAANDHFYTPTTTRVFKPNSGGLHAHIGNEFFKELPEFKHVLSLLDKNYQMNFLLIVQQAEFDGELELYDLTWDNTPRHLVEGQKFYDHYTLRGDEIESYDKFPLKLESGDLLLFDGGNIWHGVQDIKGSNDRVTMAGFMGYTNDKKEIVVYN